MGKLTFNIYQHVMDCHFRGTEGRDGALAAALERWCGAFIATAGHRGTLSQGQCAGDAWIAGGCVMEMWRVIWEIDIEAANAEEAAGRALCIMRDDDPANTAVVFTCIDRLGESRVVDLLVVPDAD